ncbi:MAG: hypothetical protein M1814_006792 [Vezdaea aestivalis]|nr:MAG: hypothetical protein M1814_006792 [Vezdaea aestivalis]
MADSEAQLALDTISHLEIRLQQLEFVLGGGGQDELGQFAQKAPLAGAQHSREQTVGERMAHLERSLSHLASRNRVVQDLLRLQSRHPDLFAPASPAQEPLLLDSDNIQQIVLASGPLYHSTASRLQSIEDAPVPPGEASAAIVKLQPRVAALALKQESQTRRLAELRSRSAEVLERWYRMGVMASGECWAEWEGRVGTVERGIRRREVDEEENRLHPL